MGPLYLAVLINPHPPSVFSTFIPVDVMLLPPQQSSLCLHVTWVLLPASPLTPPPPLHGPLSGFPTSTPIPSHSLDTFFWLGLCLEISSHYSAQLEWPSTHQPFAKASQVLGLQEGPPGFCCCFCLFVCLSLCVALTCLELTEIFLPLFPECWD